MIFESTRPVYLIKDDKVNDDMLSFKDCPNNCVKGKIFNPYTHDYKDCPYCTEKRKNAVLRNIDITTDKQNITDLLNLPISACGINLDMDSIIPERLYKDMDKDSILNCMTKLQEIYDSIMNGVMYKETVLMVLGQIARLNNFIYPYMLRSYMNNLSVAPYLTTYDLLVLRQMGREAKGFTYNDLLNKDICVVTIDTGATEEEILAVAGLMQLRGDNGLSTLIFAKKYTTKLFNRYFNGDGGNLSESSIYTIKYDKDKSNKANKDLTLGDFTSLKN